MKHFSELFREWQQGIIEWEVIENQSMLEVQTGLLSVDKKSRAEILHNYLKLEAEAGDRLAKECYCDGDLNATLLNIIKISHSDSQ